MKSNIYSIIVLVSIFSVLIPIITYLFKSKGGTTPRQNKIILAILVVSIMADGISYVLMRKSISNALTNNFQDIVTFALFNLFYYEILYRKRIGYLMILGILLYCATVVYVTATIGLFVFQDYFWAVGSIILGVHAILYSVNIPSMPLERLLDKNLYSNLIINGALAFYFFTTLFIFAFSTFVFTQTDTDTSRLFWSFHNLVNVVKNIGIAIGFYFTGKRSVYITLEQLEVLGRKQDATADF